jgi:hypothetical protein
MRGFHQTSHTGTGAQTTGSKWTDYWSLFVVTSFFLHEALSFPAMGPTQYLTLDGMQRMA